MPLYCHADVLVNGLKYLQDNCNKVALIGSYTFNDTYATVSAGILAEYAATPSHFVFINSPPGEATLRMGGVSYRPVLAAGGGAGNHIALLDTVNAKVLWVFPESSMQVIEAGNEVNFPVFDLLGLSPT